MPTRIIVALLAIAATTTAACLSIQSGMQRGGLPVERALWVAVGVVLVIAAHLLPALCRPLGWRVRAVGAVIWIGCVAATCYGHAVFFLTSARHAGEIRAASIPSVTPRARDLTAIARDRADAVARLARANARRCTEPCPSLTAERTALAAKLEAIDVEHAEAARDRAAQDRAAIDRAAAQSDPVTGPLSAFGWSASRADLFAGLAFALVLEAVACFAWLLAIRPAAVKRAAETPAHQGSNAVTVTPVAAVTQPSHDQMPAVTAPPEPLTVPDDVARILDAIAAGDVRPTVTEIRKYLGCSQTRAAIVRRSVEAATALKETMHANPHTGVHC
ncbi:hypothetical protein [Pandoraea bronchicola]|uniref:Uncharacterized protein n=1 Tax=Pandoraea bronchicola TaxID=2508287 RepID=A0A5E5C0L1_9BURK|nr:hypothetical protein [Pandoraea bronchicola]VVE90775.1 hypothetical protein PBR20603_04763 [Pandoraea bronchicola]